MQPGLPDRGAVHRSKLNDPRRKKTCSAADVKHKDLLWVSGDHSQRVHLDSQVPFSDSRRSSKVLPCDPNLQVCLGYKRTPSSALATPPSTPPTTSALPSTPRHGSPCSPASQHTRHIPRCVFPRSSPSIHRGKSISRDVHAFQFATPSPQASCPLCQFLRQFLVAFPTFHRPDEPPYLLSHRIPWFRIPSPHRVRAPGNHQTPAIPTPPCHSATLKPHQPAHQVPKRLFVSRHTTIRSLSSRRATSARPNVLQATRSMYCAQIPLRHPWSMLPPARLFVIAAPQPTLLLLRQVSQMDLHLLSACPWRLLTSDHRSATRSPFNLL